MFLLHRYKRKVGLLFTLSSFRSYIGQTVDEYVTLYKELAYFPEQSQMNLDHVAGLRNIADKSHELATKAANAAVFVAREQVGVL